MAEEAKKLERSSDKLRTNVANFMRRADTIVEHPLAGTNPTIAIQVTFDPETTAIAKAGLDELHRHHHTAHRSDAKGEIRRNTGPVAPASLFTLR